MTHVFVSSDMFAVESYEIRTHARTHERTHACTRMHTHARMQCTLGEGVVAVECYGMNVNSGLGWIS